MEVAVRADPLCPCRLRYHRMRLLRRATVSGPEVRPGSARLGLPTAQRSPSAPRRRGARSARRPPVSTTRGARNASRAVRLFAQRTQSGGGSQDVPMWEGATAGLVPPRSDDGGSCSLPRATRPPPTAPRGRRVGPRRPLAPGHLLVPIEPADGQAPIGRVVQYRPARPHRSARPWPAGLHPGRGRAGERTVR
jgi:hypothetical protein